jgi:hypothetical protein
MLLTVVAIALAAPVELVPNQIYAPGTEVGVAALGVSLPIPPQWQGVLAPSGMALVLASDQVAGVVLVVAEQTTADAVATALAGPVPLDESATLKATAAVSKQGGVWKVNYTVVGQPGMAGWGRARMGDHGTGVAVFTAGPEADASRLASLADQVLQSVILGAPSAGVPVTASPGESSGPWADRLRGRRLKYLYTNNGFSDEWSLDLCSEGQFIYRNRSSSSSFQTGSLTSNGGDTGTWSIQGDQIHLKYADGRTEDASLQAKGDTVLWSGTRTFVQPIEGCQ